MNEIEPVDITPEMLKAGEDIILSVVGSSASSCYFATSALAEQVFRAMLSARPSGP
jgi:hypothetical protein